MIGALIAWAVGKARRVGKALDDIADEVAEASRQGGMVASHGGIVVSVGGGHRQ